MAQHYDIIVIGGGHNGLVNAAYLAKAGKKVLVLERRHLLGGAAVTEEIIPGFLFSECSYVVSLLRPEIIRELDLPRHGLEILPLDGTFTPMPNGDYLWRVNDHAKSIRDIRRHSRVDAEAYDEFSKMMTPMCRFVKPILSMIPPDPTTLNPKDLKQLHFLWQRFRELSSDERYTLVQLMTMSSADFLDQWFETDILKATMSASGIIGTFLGIRSPGTAYVLLHHYMGEIDGAFRSWGFSRGGTGAISNAIAGAAREAGVEIRTKAPVGKILTKNGRAAGVVLQSGEEILANVVSSSVDPHLTFEKFLEPSELPADFLEGVRRYKFRGSSGKVNLALDALPNFKCFPGPGAHLRGAMAISPASPTSTWLFPASPIPASRLPANTCSPASYNTRRTNSPKALGTIRKKPSAKTSSTPSASTPPTSKTSSSDVRSSPRSISSANSVSHKAIFFRVNFLSNSFSSFAPSPAGLTTAPPSIT